MSVSQPSTARPLQSLNPGSQLPMPQLPPVHFGIPLALMQTFVHEPQLLGLVSMSTSHPFAATASQSRKPVLHAMPQWPATHVGVAWGACGQTCPHIPQLFGSVWRLITHPLPPQAAKPGLQPGEPEPEPLEPVVLEPEATPLEPAVLDPDPMPLDPVPVEPALLEPDPMPLDPEGTPEATLPEPEVADPEAIPLDPDPFAPAVLEPEVSPLVPTALEPDDRSFADPSSESTTMLEPPHAASNKARAHPLPTPNAPFIATVLSLSSRARIRASLHSIASFGRSKQRRSYWSSGIDQVIPGPAQRDLAIMASAPL